MKILACRTWQGWAGAEARPTDKDGMAGMARIIKLKNLLPETGAIFLNICP